MQGGVGKELMSVEASIVAGGMSFSDRRVGSVGEKAKVTFFLWRVDLELSGRECIEDEELQGDVALMELHRGVTFMMLSCEGEDV